MTVVQIVRLRIYTVDHYWPVCTWYMLFDVGSTLVGREHKQIHSESLVVSSTYRPSDLILAHLLRHVCVYCCYHCPLVYEVLRVH